MFEIISSIKACLFSALRDRVWKIQWQSICSCQESTPLKLTVKIGDQFSKKLLQDLFCQWKSTRDDSDRNVHWQSFIHVTFGYLRQLPSSLPDPSRKLQQLVTKCTIWDAVITTKVLTVLDILMHIIASTHSHIHMHTCTCFFLVLSSVSQPFNLFNPI